MASPYYFITFAGSTTSGGADGTGSAAQFNSPYSVAVDSAGIVYVADTYNHDVRKITPARVVSTLAGSAGNFGNADGTGSAAQFFYPEGIAVDSSTGVVYVGDTNNQTIRKITPAGVVSTLAGLAGSIGSADGMGSTARFWLPHGLALDSMGNVYVADTDNHTIRKITPAGLVSTFAGLAGSPGGTDGLGSAARFSNPYDVVLDSAGNVYVADFGNHIIRKITPAGLVSTLAGLAGAAGTADGTGNAARFNFPGGVTLDSAGNVYVTDTSNETIRKVTPDGLVSTLAGLAGSTGTADGTGSAARFNHAYGVAMKSAGKMYLADSFNNTIRLGATLTVTAITRPASNTIHLQCVGVPNVVNRIESSSVPSAGSFGTLGSVTADSAGAVPYDDTSAGTKKFYRLAYP